MPTTSWHERAAALQIDGHAVIDGERAAAGTGARFDCLSPVDRRWAGKPPAERKKILIRLADLSRAIRTASALRAGTVHVTQCDSDDITVPFGGYQQSGNGRDKSLHAFDKYTELKTTWVQVG